MKFLFVMDPMDRLHVEGDTTFALMVEAQRRGHETWTCGPMDLVMRQDQAYAYAERQAVTYTPVDPRDPLHHVLEAGDFPLAGFDAVWMRKDPPIGVNYFMATIVLGHAEGQTAVVNGPAALRDWNEKLAALKYPDLTPPTVVTSRAAELRRFLEEQGGDMIVKPLDASGALAFSGRAPGMKTWDPSSNKAQTWASACAWRKSTCRPYAQGTSAFCCWTGNCCARCCGSGP